MAKKALNKATVAIAAAEALTAVNAAYWFIENSNEDDPNRNLRFFCLRSVFDRAQVAAAAAGVSPSHDEAWQLVTANDKPTGDDLMRAVLTRNGLTRGAVGRIMRELSGQGLKVRS